MGWTIVSQIPWKTITRIFFLYSFISWYALFPHAYGSGTPFSILFLASSAIGSVRKYTLAAPYTTPEQIPIPLKTSGYVAPRIQASDPPADKPAAYTLFESILYLLLTSLIIS